MDEKQKGDTDAEVKMASKGRAQDGVRITRREGLLSLFTGALLSGATVSSGTVSAQQTTGSGDNIEVAIQFPTDKEEDGVNYREIGWTEVSEMDMFVRESDSENFVVRYTPKAPDGISSARASHIPDTQLTAKIQVAIDRDENPNRTFETIGEETKEGVNTELQNRQEILFKADDMQQDDSLKDNQVHNLKNHKDSDDLNNIIPSVGTEDASNGNAPSKRTTFDFRIQVSSDKGSIDAERIVRYKTAIGRVAGLGMGFGRGFGYGSPFGN